MNVVERSNDGVVLRKCPFCGGEASLSNNAVKKGDTWLWSIECIDCGVFMDDEYDFHVINRWNNRKPLERVIERLEERIRILDNTSDINYPSVDVAIKETKRIIEIIKEEMM